MRRASWPGSGCQPSTAKNLLKRQIPIDDMLRDRALECGESRVGERRILPEAPLGVIFYVSEADMKATVLDVWRY